MNDVSLDSLVVYCADIGSIPEGNFAWASRCIDSQRVRESGKDIWRLVTQVACDLNNGKKVALGFECPLWVPVSCDPMELTSARCGEGNRPWSAGAGATSLATGLTETAWILSEIRSEAQDVEAYLDGHQFKDAEHGLFLWEAMVTGENRTGSHEGDAAAAVCAFIKALSDIKAANAVTSPHKVRSLIGAALLWAGWSEDHQLLRTPCVVIRPKSTRRDASG